MTLTKKDADVFIAEFRKDLDAYRTALDLVQRRRLEAEQNGHDQYFSKSSGCVALTHLLIMNVSQTEGIIEDLLKNREELPDARPALELVKDEVNHV